MRMFKKEEGFTLVELMVVVLIIGILVAIAIPVFNNATATARERTCHANQRTIDGSVEQYLAANTTVTKADMDDVQDLVDGGFIAAEPLCPANDEAYTLLNGVVQGCPNAGEPHGSYKVGASF